MDRLLGGQLLSEPQSDRRKLDLELNRQWLFDLQDRNGQLPPATLRELEARLRRLADVLPETPASRLRNPVILGKATASKAEQMAAYIARRHQQPLPVNDVALQVHLHPNYAMTLFKRTLRTTVNDFITQYRIAHADRLLATTDEKVIDVALDAGFRTPSRFYDAFERACGCPPHPLSENQAIKPLTIWTAERAHTMVAANKPVKTGPD